MPGQWTSIETNFPSLTGQEPVKDQIRQMYNYLYILTEQLKYNLSNLNAENFNAKALDKLAENTSSEAAKLIASDLEKITGLYAQLNSRVASLSGSLAALAGRVNVAEGEIDRLGLAVAETEERMQAVEETVSGLEQTAAEQKAELDDLTAGVTALEENADDQDQRLGEAEKTLEGLAEAFTVQDDGATLGAEGKVLRLVGDVYINGVLFTPQQNGE